MNDSTTAQDLRPGQDNAGPEQAGPEQPAQPIDAQVRAAIKRIARVPRLLVACDYDGTLAPIVEVPTKAVPLPESVAAVRSLASLSDTTVAVISGRALRDLAAMSRLPSEVHLVGSHGSEFDVDFVDALDPEHRWLRDQLQEKLTRLVRDEPGVRLELKPASIAVHTRGADRAVAERVVAAVEAGPASWPRIQVTRGKEVIELSVIETNKGSAVNALRGQFAAAAVMYLGDDVTDENAFRVLHAQDIGIKVGPGESVARLRVADPVEAARVLGLLYEYRSKWLHGERAVPIEQHSMLSNGRAVALVTPDSRITWLCHPRPDSGAVFADLLGGTTAGYFSVRPERADRPPLAQRYRPGTMTVETQWSGVTVTDWLDHEPANGEPAGGWALTEAGSASGGTTLVRMLTGTTRVRVEFAPRPDFGQVHVTLQEVGDGLLVLGSNEPIVLRSPGVDWEITDDGTGGVASAVIDLSSMDGPVVVELRLGSNSVEPHVQPPSKRQEISEGHRQDWVKRLRLPGTTDDVRRFLVRSALTLRGLWFEPSGAILAAATTSLPEAIPGQRNWDYRYCWLRDAAMTARALVDLGSTVEADALLGWIMRIVAGTGGHPERLHPLYTLDGSELGSEAVIETLAGYAGVRPVRVGNAANRQVQLDVFGPVADLIAELAGHRAPTELDIELMEAMVSAVERRWHEPDHGIWEARLPPRQHVYSKVMCWLTVDRGLQMWRRLGRPERLDWVRLRDTIAEQVLTRGWNEAVGAYTVAYGENDLDASALWIGLAGLLPDDDPRFLSTVLKIEADLRNGRTVYRYLFNDGIAGLDGGFHICTAWLIEAYLRTGRRTEAEELFEQMLDCAGPTGLLPEQYDPDSARSLGNHPQAYSHIGLIRCAIMLSAAPATS